MPKEKKQESTLDHLDWLIILLILWLLFKSPFELFADKKREILHEKIRTREGILRERELLRKVLSEKEQEIARLNEAFVSLYQRLRIGLAIIWIIVTAAMLMCFGFWQGVGLAVDLNGFLLFMILLFNFVLYGKISDTKELVGQMEERIRAWIYRNSAGIKEELVQYNSELDIVESRIDAINREIDELDSK